MLSLLDKLGARVGSVVPCHQQRCRGLLFLKRGCSGFPITPFIQCLYSCSVEFRSRSFTTCSACGSATVDQIRDQVWFLQRWWQKKRDISELSKLRKLLEAKSYQVAKQEKELEDEDKQLKALDGLNKFIITKEKMFKAIDAGMLDTVTNLVKLANDYHLLPVPHARIMETTQTLVAIPSLKIRFGVEANLCNVLVGEIQELVDGILASVKEAEQRQRDDKREAQLKAREKKGGVSSRPRAVNMMVTFVSGTQPIGIKVGVPPTDPKGGVIEVLQYGSQASGVSEKEWPAIKDEIEKEKILLDEENERLKVNSDELTLINKERKKRSKARESLALNRPPVFAEASRNATIPT